MENIRQEYGQADSNAAEVAELKREALYPQACTIDTILTSQLVDFA